jgi:hypothetical protein
MSAAVYKKPVCPEHPESYVVNAKNIGAKGTGRVWCCIACGKKLGEAPPHEPTWESMTIEGTKK